MTQYQKYFHPTMQDITQYSDVVLGADIGGTHTILTIGGLYNKKITLLVSFHFKTQTLDSVNPAIYEVLKYAKTEYNYEITNACLGAAGIISPDQTQAELTNVPWNISTRELQQHTSLHNILLINDFQTLGYGINIINHTNPHEILQIPTDNNHSFSQATKAILGAGTGLGKTIILYSETEKIYLPYPSEGGHADCPLYTTEEHELAQYIKKQKHNAKPLTYEDILSGGGIGWIYSYLRKHNNNPSSIYTSQIDNATDKADKISQYRHQDTTCQQTFSYLARFFGRCAKNFALDILPTGGLYIAGGIAIKNQDILFNQEFLREYYNAYHRTELLKTMPLYLITDPYLGQRGACFAALQQLK
ncbi:MAG: glucokinase [Candidatus Thermoplasmatota archaeon]|nr:glucokinase [Candidatus Thermoplasmatota archaeon]MBU1941026.1 glucokinase [Candidatus Thermoplasmatota archaeon]